MEHLKYAWQIVSENLVGWVIFGLVFSLVTSFTGGLGLFLMPNAIRGTRKAIAGNAAPEVGDLFQFDTIADDAVAMLGQSVANFAGSLLCGIGALATAPMFLFAPFVVTEGTYDGVGSLKVTLEHGKQHPGNLIQPLSWALPAVFTLSPASVPPRRPLALVALSTSTRQRPHVFAAAQAAQIPAKG